MSNLTFLFLVIFVSTSLACREQYNNRTRTGGHSFRYDYSRGRYTSYETLINNCTIVCANIYSINQIFYTYKERSFDQFLKVTESNITSLEPNELSQFATIAKLYLSDIHVKKIMPGAFSGLSRLKELYLSNNELTEVSKGVFNSLQRLELLDLSGNKIRHIEKFTLMGVSNLQKLFLQNNNLSKIDNDTFGKLTHLTQLDLSENPLKEVTLDNMLDLDILNLSRTSLTHFGDLSITNWTLKLLNLSSTQISNVDFLLFPKTEVLDLRNNVIDNIQNCHKLQSTAVCLQNNKIKSIDQGFSGLSQIVLSHNQIQNINKTLFNKSENLLYLDLSFNNISTIDVDTLKDMTSLQYLQLQNNNITKLDPAVFRNMTSLTYLDLSYNKIEDLQFGTFNSLKMLLILDISHNNLHELHPFLFYSISHLQKLYFGYNQITTFDVKDLTTHLPSILYISLDGNPWECKQLVGMSHVLKNMSVTIAEGDSYFVENFRGIACQHEQENTSDTLAVKDMFDEYRKIVNETVQNSQMMNYLNEGFMNSKFVKFFEENYNSSNFDKFLTTYEEKLDEKLKSPPVSSEIKAIEHRKEKPYNGILIFSVILQVVMCCLLVFIVFLMYTFLKKSQPQYGMDRLSQVELC